MDLTKDMQRDTLGLPFQNVSSIKSSFFGILMQNFGSRIAGMLLRRSTFFVSYRTN